MATGSEGVPQWQNIRLQGVVKSYHVSNGWGFIMCKEIKESFQCDVFMHKNEVSASGAIVGDPVTFALRLNKAGKPQAVLVECSDRDPQPENDQEDSGKEGSAARSRSVGPGARGRASERDGSPQRGRAKSVGGKRAARPKIDVPESAPGTHRYKGKVKSFNTNNGFGFIECHAITKAYSRDTFLHQKQLGDFKVGDWVTFNIELNPNTGYPQARVLMKSDENDPDPMRQNFKHEMGHEAPPIGAPWANYKPGARPRRGDDPPPPPPRQGAPQSPQAAFPSREYTPEVKAQRAADRLRLSGERKMDALEEAALREAAAAAAA